MVECDASSYGSNCSFSCGQCNKGVPCNKKNGRCLSGCASGYEGIYCNKSKQNFFCGLDNVHHNQPKVFESNNLLFKLSKMVLFIFNIWVFNRSNSMKKKNNENLINKKYVCFNMFYPNAYTNFKNVCYLFTCSMRTFVLWTGLQLELQYFLLQPNMWCEEWRVS